MPSSGAKMYIITNGRGYKEAMSCCRIAVIQLADQWTSWKIQKI